MKNFWEINKTKIALLLIILFGAFLRLYNLNWDDGHFLHPDERIYVNSSSIYIPEDLSLLFIPDSPLNSKEFSYGAFPLFVYKIVQTFIFPKMEFLFVSRLVSSIFSIATIPFVFLLSKEIFGKKTGLIAAVVFAFSAGSIQHAHFNTTENILILLVTIISLLSIKAIKKHNYLLFLGLGVLVGISYASKITGLTFLIFPFMVFIFLFFKKNALSKLVPALMLFSFSAVIAGLLFAPYQIIDFSRFKERQEYEQNVVYGKDKPVYTIIYEQTKPYIFQLTKVLPFTFGFVSLPLSLIGFILILKKLKSKNKNFLYLLVIIYPILYFLWAGSWYVKFSRYYVLLIPFLSIWTSVALAKFKKEISFVLLLLITINGLLYLRVYIKPNTRIEASSWIYQNVPTQSVIAGEHWDDGLPVPLVDNFKKQYEIIQLPVYEQDSKEKISNILATLRYSHYLILSSRRVYYSILNNPQRYPYTIKFYKDLFNGKLGFKLVKKITNYPFYFSDDFADESFQSYDHPPVLIFKNANNGH